MREEGATGRRERGRTKERGTEELRRNKRERKWKTSRVKVLERGGTRKRFWLSYSVSNKV